MATLVDDHYATFASSAALPSDAVDELATRGFVVLPGPPTRGTS